MKGGEMKNHKLKLGVLNFSLFLIFLFATDTLCAESSVIIGQNNEDHDVKAIQEAVDKGGTILLKGNYNFGKKGQVSIKNDIEIIGESDSKGTPSTRITGGFWTFHTALPSTELPLPGPGPKIKIKKIHFDGVTWTPMHFPYTSGIEITGNKITNVQPFELPIKWKGGDSIWVQTGAVMGTRFAHKDKFLPGAVTGNLIFKNNHVDLNCQNPKITMGHGAFFPWTWGAVIEVKGNTFKNVSRNSIETLDNYIDEKGQGSVAILENKIITPSEGCPFPGATTYPSGIVVGWFFDRSGAADPTKNSKITIARNFVQANGELSTGISSMADGTVIIGNRIELKGGKKCKAITQFGSNGFIARNKIDGAGQWAVSAVQWEEFKGSGNTFAWNDIREFKAFDADFFCLGDKNTIVGTKCKVVDKGGENRVLVMN